jgi:uncharacterized membrane protein
MVKTYNFTPRVGQYQSTSSSGAKAKATYFCRTRKKAFTNLNIKNQPQNIIAQWDKVKQAVDEDCEKIIQQSNSNGNINESATAYVLDIQQQINKYAKNLQELKFNKVGNANANANAMDPEAGNNTLSVQNGNENGNVNENVDPVSPASVNRKRTHTRRRKQSRRQK